MWIFSAFGTLNFFGDTGVFAQAGNRRSRRPHADRNRIAAVHGRDGQECPVPAPRLATGRDGGAHPVSALIHAATMVTAGIYLIARRTQSSRNRTSAMFVIATVGAFTAFMAATIAITQNDIKRIVAYSTVSQSGYMAFGLGTGAFASGIFHLMTHAFFKGLLFLGCGAVIHGMHEEQDIQKMGGLRKYLPITFYTFLIGSLANAGVVPFAGFWSKDEVISGAWTSTVFPNWGKVIAIVGLAAAFLTAFYMFRLVFLTFFGRPRFDEHEIHPHEAGPAMTIPLMLLAIPSLLIGFVGFPPDDGRFHKFIEPVFSSGHEAAATVSDQTASTFHPAGKHRRRSGD